MLSPQAGDLLVSPQPLFDYLKAQGGTMEGEYIVVAGWPVQFLPAANPLVLEAVEQAVEKNVAGVSARVFTAEHLAAISLQTGRAKDKARLLQFIEAGARLRPTVAQGSCVFARRSENIRANSGLQAIFGPVLGV